MKSHRTCYKTLEEKYQDIKQTNRIFINENIKIHPDKHICLRMEEKFLLRKINRSRNTIFPPIRELMSIAIIMTLIVFHGLRDCTEMKRDVLMRSNLNLGNYLTYFYRNDSYIEDQYIEVNKLIFSIQIGIVKDPSIEGSQYNRDWFSNLYSTVNTTEFLKTILSKEKHELNTVRRGLADIRDFKNLRSSDSILPLTSDLYYFTRLVSSVKVFEKMSLLSNIKDTGRSYKLNEQRKTDYINAPHVELKYDPNIGGSVSYYPFRETDFDTILYYSVSLWERILQQTDFTDFEAIYYNPNFEQIMLFKVHLNFDTTSAIHSSIQCECFKPFGKFKNYPILYWTYFFLFINGLFDLLYIFFDFTIATHIIITSYCYTYKQKHSKFKLENSVSKENKPSCQTNIIFCKFCRGKNDKSNNDKLDDSVFEPVIPNVSNDLNNSNLIIDDNVSFDSKIVTPAIISKRQSILKASQGMDDSSLHQLKHIDFSVHQNSNENCKREINFENELEKNKPEQNEVSNKFLNILNTTPKKIQDDLKQSNLLSLIENKMKTWAEIFIDNVKLIHKKEFTEQLCNKDDKFIAVEIHKHYGSINFIKLGLLFFVYHCCINEEYILKFKNRVFMLFLYLYAVTLREIILKGSTFLYFIYFTIVSLLYQNHRSSDTMLKWFNNENLGGRYLENSKNSSFKEDFFDISEKMAWIYTIERYLVAMCFVLSFLKLVLYANQSNRQIKEAQKLVLLSVRIIYRNINIFLIILLYIILQGFIVHFMYGHLNENFSKLQTVLFLSLNTLSGNFTLYYLIAEHDLFFAIIIAAFNYMLVVIIFMQVILIDVVKVLLDSKNKALEYAKKNPFNFFSIASTIKWLSNSTILCFVRCYNKRKYEKKKQKNENRQIYISQQLKVKKSKQFDIRITDPLYKLQYQYFLGNMVVYTDYWKVTAMNNIIIFIDIIVLLIQIFSLQIQLPNLGAKQNSTFVKITHDNLIQAFNYTNVTTFSEQEVRRTFVDIMPQYLSNKVVKVKKPNNRHWPVSMYINTETSNILSGFVIHTQYNELEETNAGAFKHYTPYKYSNKRKTTGLPIRDLNYTINYYITPQDELDASHFVTNKNVTYKWENDNYYALITSEDLESMIYTFEKLVLDKFINKYTDYVTINYLMNPMKDHKNMALVVLSWKRNGGDGFYFKYEQYNVLIDTENFLYQDGFTIVLNQIYCIFQIIRLTIQTISSWKIYNIWYSFEIQKKFCKFMIMMREKKQHEFTRKISALPIYELCQMISLFILTLSQLITSAFYYFQAKKKEDRLNHQDQFNIDTQIGLIKYVNTLFITKCTLIGLIFLIILLHTQKLIDQISIVPVFKRYRTALIETFKYIVSHVVLQLAFYLVMQSFIIHAINGMDSQAYSQLPNITMVFKMITTLVFVNPEPRMMDWHWLEILLSQLYTLILVNPLKFVLFSIILVEILLHTQKAYTDYEYQVKESDIDNKRTYRDSMMIIKEIVKNTFHIEKNLVVDEFELQTEKWINQVKNPDFYSEFFDYSISSKLSSFKKIGIRETDINVPADRMHNQINKLSACNLEISNVFFKLKLFKKALNSDIFDNDVRVISKKKRLLEKYLDIIVDDGYKANHCISFERMLVSNSEMSIRDPKGKGHFSRKLNKLLNGIKSIESQIILIKLISDDSLKKVLSNITCTMAPKDLTREIKNSPKKKIATSRKRSSAKKQIATSIKGFSAN